MNQPTLFKRYADLHEQLTSERSKYDQCAALNTWNATDEQLTLNEFELSMARLKIQKLEEEIVKLLNKFEVRCEGAYTMNEDAEQALDFDEWSGAQQADEDAQRQRILEAWQRIKSGLYTDRDIDIIEYELRSVL